MKNRQNDTYKEFCKIRNKVRNITRKQQKQFETNLALKSKSNPKAVWKYIKSKTQVTSDIPDLITYNNNNPY